MVMSCNGKFKAARKRAKHSTFDRKGEVLRPDIKENVDVLVKISQNWTKLTHLRVVTSYFKHARG